MESPPHQWFDDVGLCVVSAFLFIPIIMSPSLSVYAQSPSYPVEIENVRLVDPGGQPLDDCQPGGELVMIAVTLKNLSDSGQPAAIIVELRDNSSDITQFVQWQTTSIGPKATPQVAISFNPASLSSSSSSSSAVQYDANVLVWDKVLTPVPLSSPLKVPVSC
ncbi:hypothetical protein NVIE_012930 [Nitrososphaera viennensis EN76]|uniref:DUF11 domain-containing protein n=2 Tax=Nitrososphaera viennensis TaxID=1034015 RepID=A0A060HJ28_9ARCH|nr:hypothetical protein NVIE_012930 [Nitrososphaera viennensis EN76]